MAAELGESFYRNLLENLFDAVYFVDRDRRITYWNQAAERLTGYSAAEVVGRCCADNILNHVGEDGCLLCPADTCPAAATIREGTVREARVFLHHKDGHRVPVLNRISPVIDASGQVIGAVEVFSDNSAQIAAGEQIEQLRQAALIDPLTEVGNRRYGELRLKGLFSELERFAWPLSLAFVDIDHFKRVNDEYGHDAGDAVLTAVAKTLVGAVRGSDIVVRWGGEEFLIVLRNAGGDILNRVLEKVRVLVSGTFVPTRSGRLSVTVSIGGTVARQDESPETLVARADRLMYESKRAGRDRVATDT